MTDCVLVTAKEYGKSRAVFESAADLRVKSAPLHEQALSEAVVAEGCRAVILGVDNYTGPLYEALGRSGGGRGAIIARYGVGHDGVDKQLARQHDIVVTNTPGVLDDSVAEHTVWLVGALARQVARHDRNMKSAQWDPAIGQEIRDRTLLIVGCGNIGRKVARIAAFGFRMKVVGFDVLPLDAGRMKNEFGIDAVASSLEGVLAEADVVSVHLPANDLTRHFVDAAFLAGMSPGALLVNTSRGSIVDERALYEALSNGGIAGAALDVFEREPYEPVDAARDLRTLAQVVLTPHIGSSTAQACERAARCCLKNIGAFLAGDMRALDSVGAAP